MRFSIRPDWTFWFAERTVWMRGMPMLPLPGDGTRPNLPLTVQEARGLYGFYCREALAHEAAGNDDARRFCARLAIELHQAIAHAAAAETTRRAA